MGIIIRGFAVRTCRWEGGRAGGEKAKIQTVFFMSGRHLCAQNEGSFLITDLLLTEKVSLFVKRCL